MRLKLLICLLAAVPAAVQAQPRTRMEPSFIRTRLGPVAVYQQAGSSGLLPVVFLHGVYFDHHLWDGQMARISGRTLIAIDMPLHGQSREGIMPGWTLNDCAGMLLDVLDSLGLERVIAAGHSWGSMTIVRAAALQPARFAAAGLCNMPFRALDAGAKRAIRLQHMALVFRKFYMRQAAASLMSPHSLARQPELMDQLLVPMSRLSGRDIRHTDRAVRLEAEDAAQLAAGLPMPVLAVAGEEDYAGLPPVAQAWTVPGGHISPLEAPDAVARMLAQLLEAAGSR